MPFVQRVVQPVNLAQVCSTSGSGNQKTNKFLCIPGKCQNNNCINNKLSPQHQQQQLQQQQQQRGEISLNGREPAQSKIAAESEFLSSSSSSSPPPPSLSLNPSDVLLSRTTSLLNSNAKDGLISPSLTSSTTASSTTTVTTAIIHNNGGVSTINDLAGKDTTDHVGYTNSFSYNTDHEDDVCSSVLPPVSPAPTMPMKKLKQHVEFLSNIPTSPTRQQSARSGASMVGGTSMAGSSGAIIRASTSQQQQLQQQQRLRTPQSPTATKIVAGYEFDSISNITLSNALRQLASLVLIASDIFDDLQKELQSVGDRARVVQKKIIAVERRVSAYDPKMVTVLVDNTVSFAMATLYTDYSVSARSNAKVMRAN
uniref:Uncharacterized protein n=1 Tax=Musca domestica TaxID=7370 RepID=A0A1I8NKS9_MUSDO